MMCRATGRTHWLRALVCVAIGAATLGCGEDPEEVLLGRWHEQHWRYEKFDGYDPARAKFIDGIMFPQYADRRIVRHEAEYWEFLPNRRLVISKRDGSQVLARWRLKGRGHVLTVRYQDSNALEIYDIKKLDRNTLVLHYDIGMEVRGIAKLTFGRKPNGDLAQEAG